MTDNAKELLALADELSAYIKRYSGDWSAASPTISWDELHAVVSALRLSARQHASVEEVARTLDPSAFVDLGPGFKRAQKIETELVTLEARALLAKYDIFQKVEG